MEDLKNITLTFDAKTLDYIANALARCPYLEVAPILQEIGRQVAAQNPQAGKAPEMPGNG